jgi:hypothetical protein
VFIHYHERMSVRYALLTEINQVPECVLVETLHFMRFAARQQEENEWRDLLPSREVEQEVIDLLDAP